jgi:hypothetical protein
MRRIGVIAMSLTLAAIAVAGLVESLRADHGGIAILFAFLFLGVLGLAWMRAGESSVSLRRDLSSWLERTSVATGESPEAMANRAVSRLRAGFGRRPGSEG